MTHPTDTPTPARPAAVTDAERINWNPAIVARVVDSWRSFAAGGPHSATNLRSDARVLLDTLEATQAALTEAQREREALMGRAIALAGQAVSARGLLRLIAMSPDDPPLPALLTAIEAELNAGESVDSPLEQEARHDA